MRPRARIILLMLLTLGGVLPLSIYFTTPAAHGMVKFSSYGELENFLLTRAGCNYGLGFRTYGQYGQSNLLGGPVPLGAPNPALHSTTAASSSVSYTPSHSETNNQVAGVDELDKVKTDGQYIYTVSNNTVSIVNSFPLSNAQLISRISLPNQTIDGIFVDGSRLSVISEAPLNPSTLFGQCIFGTPGAILQPLGCYCPVYTQVQKTSISVYDITNRSSPSLKNSITVNGTFVGARQIGDYVYLVASTPARHNQTLPVTIVNGVASKTEATQIYHSDVSDSAFSYSIVVAVNASQDKTIPTIQNFLLGTSSTIYVSLTNIFLTQPIWDSQMGTAIHRISINGPSISYQATGTVPGHVLNQYSMDESNGYFRVATSTYGWGSSLVTNVYVLGENLVTFGRLEGLSPGELFYAARFMGDRGYLVTYHNTDPLYVLDLHNPSSPTVLGTLYVEGYSDYLQPYDQTHLIGIGKVGVHTSVKVSLFDVTDPTKPVQVANYTVPSWYSDSPALTDAKAVLFDKSLNLLVIPIQESQYTYYPTPYPTECSTSSAAYVFNVTSTSLSLRGNITHQTTTSSPYSCGPEFYITRSLYIGNLLYTVSNAMIMINNLSDLTEVGSVILA